MLCCYWHGDRSFSVQIHRLWLIYSYVSQICLNMKVGAVTVALQWPRWLTKAVRYSQLLSQCYWTNPEQVSVLSRLRVAPISPASSIVFVRFFCLFVVRSGCVQVIQTCLSLLQNDPVTNSPQRAIQDPAVSWHYVYKDWAGWETTFEIGCSETKPEIYFCSGSWSDLLQLQSRSLNDKISSRLSFCRCIYTSLYLNFVLFNITF